MAKRVRMLQVDDFMKEAEVLNTHYRDGLISKGEFVRTCMSHLTNLTLRDLGEAQRIVESYGYTGNDFSTFMHEQAKK